MGWGGGGDYTEEWRMWHLSQQLVTRWSRSKSSFLCYKYNGKQADTGNNKQQHMPWSTSVGRKECSSSMLCISPLNSSMKELRLAHTPQLRKAWQRDMPVSWVDLFRCLLHLLWKNKLSPKKIKLCDKTPHSPLWSSECSILQETQGLIAL